MKYNKPHYGVTRPLGLVATPQQLIRSQEPKKIRKKDELYFEFSLK